MKTLFKSPDIIIKEEEDVIIVKKSLKTIMTMLALLITVSVILYLLSGSIADAALSSLMKWGACTLTGLMLLVFLVTLASSLLTKTEIDFRRQLIKRGLKYIDFSEVISVKPDIINIMGKEIINVPLQHKKGRFYLIPGHSVSYRDQIEELSARISSLIMQHNITSSPGANVPDKMLKLIPPLILILTGAVLSVSAYLLIPDVVYVHSSKLGVLFWPMGIWIMIAGAAELTRFPVANFSRKSINKTTQLIIRIAWISSYIIICLRTVT